MSKQVKKRNEADDKREAMLDKIVKLEGPNYFTEAIDAPMDLAAAIITSRPELLRAVRPKALTVEECASLYKVISTLIETNMALRDHANEVAQMTKSLLGGFTTVASVGQKIEEFANFRRHEDET